MSSYRDTVTDFDIDEAPWPRPGDDPFAIASNSRLVASLNFTHDEPWGGYAEGFKRLADIGVAHIEETGRSHDFLVYPAIFSYRHFIELTLKEVIRNATRLLDRPVVIPSTHNLSALWDTAEPLLMEIEPESTATYGDVRECLARFAELDPISESFRYPVKRNGDATLPPDLKNLDLRQVRDVVERLGSFLDAAATHTSVLLDYKAEIESAYDHSW
jgi:hypothetical protein